MFALELMQNTIKIVTEKFIRLTIDYFEVIRARPSLTANLLVTSWTRRSFDTTDFSWGKLAQSGCTNLPEKEVVLLISNGKDKKTTILLLGLPVSAMKTFLGDDASLVKYFLNIAQYVTYHLTHKGIQLILTD